jgi:lipoprotein Spr
MLVTICKNKFWIFVLLIPAFQLIITSCSRQLFSPKSFQNVDTTVESRKLKKFLEGGAEKRLEVGKTNADEIIATARKYLGVPHCMGGTTMKCIDCSGLLTSVFAQYGISLPHNSEDQARYGKIIYKKDQLTKGDLVFFIESYKTDNFITHSGIYLGNNEFIHTSSKIGVTITSLNDQWWTDKFIFGTSVFNEL